MPDINTIREELESTNRRLLASIEKLKKIAEQEKDLSRYFKEGNHKHEQLQSKLAKQREIVKSQINIHRCSIEDLKTGIEGYWNTLIDQTNPAEHLNELDSHYPVLMMPLRIETRFKKVKDVNNQVIDQLWVRAFPDDCAVDTFEALLSESEVENARDFWADWMAATCNESKQRAAWRILVENHGAGRAQYIINNYRSDNADELLTQGAREENDSILLVIKLTEGDVGSDDLAQLEAYWFEVWKANGDAERIGNAYENFNTEGGQEYKDYLIKTYTPVNLDEDFSYIEDRDDPDLDISVRFVVFPANFEDDQGIQQSTWTQAPKVKVMPERLYFLGYRDGVVKAELPGEPIPMPLICGPDPLAEKDSLEEYLDEDLRISPQMKWMVDFKEAVAKGMGFIIDDAIDRDNNVLAGYDRIMILGVRLSADPGAGKSLVEELFKHHYDGNSGFSFLPVGTNTNNVQDEAESGHTEAEDADDSFDQMFLGKEYDITMEDKPIYAENDRVWFNKILGFSSNFLTDTINTNGFDQVEARAMNVALWPATWGYFFESMMHPVFSDSTVDYLKDFFNANVIGRGTIPSIRIDDQPYGILPTTVFSRIEWFDHAWVVPGLTFGTNKDQKSLPLFYRQLCSMLRTLHGYWKEMASSVPHIGMEGDSHQILLDILGHHGGSVEFHNRINQGLNHLWNYYALAYEVQNNWSANLIKVTELFKDELKTYNNKSKGLDLLRNLGYRGEEIPEILEKYFSSYSPEITNLIDDQPLSEINPIRIYTDNEEIKGSYIHWLIYAANKSLSKLKSQEDFISGKRPTALLYIMLQHAMELGYYTSGLKLYRDNSIFNSETWARIKKEPDFIHIREQSVAPEATIEGSFSGKAVDFPLLSESKYYLLEQKIDAITGDKDLSVCDFITRQILDGNGEELYIKDQVNALKLLKDTPTAALERAFVEHLDCTSYRLDAWQWGLLNMVLWEKRRVNPEGVYVGAYGWLENVKSEYKSLTPVNSFDDSDVNDFFNPHDGNPIVKDDKNYGYIQAPSLNHAVTASILRNAYLSRASEENAEVFGINLSSERVRKALSVLEGIQGGQNLAALLGYHFERFVHDSDVENVDQYIYALRRKFPLAGNQMESTREEDPGVPIEALEASNVVEGSELIDFVESKLKSNEYPYDFGELNLNELPTSQRDVIIKAIDHIRDTNDAVADLGLAESIHQVAQGNIDRAAGTLDTYSKGNYPQIPDVVQTPRSGVNITHRVGIHINPAAVCDSSCTPRAMGEPGINSFLTDLLPPQDRIICHISIKNTDLGIVIENYRLDMQKLGLYPIDLLFIINDEVDQAMTNLDDHIIYYLQNNDFEVEGASVKLRPDTEFIISYYVSNGNKDNADEVSVFEIVPLIKNLRALLLRSRSLKPSDISMSDEFKEQYDDNQVLDLNRITGIVQYLNQFYSYDPVADVETGQLIDFISGLNDLLNTGIPNPIEIPPQIDQIINSLTDILRALSFMGISDTGIGFTWQWRKEQMNNLLNKFRAIHERWNKKNDEFIALENSYPGDGSLEDKSRIVMKAERIIRTSISSVENPDAFLAQLLIWKEENFDKKKGEIAEFITTNHQGISEAFEFIIQRHLTDISDFDLTSIDIDDFIKACKLFAEDLNKKAELLNKELKKCIKGYNEFIIAYNGEASQSNRVELIKEIAKLLFSEDFKMIPAFRIIPAVRDEWAQSVNNVENLLAYQKTKKQNPLPVDDWFYSVARVREKMGCLEQVVCWAEGFKEQSIDLIPAQFPYLEPYCWFAQEFGITDGQDKEVFLKNYRENDHLLYTAYYHHDFDPEAEFYCGLLLDEWTEIVPTEEETVGTAFHYDRPNSEPPQTMLLVTSPQFKEKWKWEDLVDAVYETLEEAILRGVEPGQIDETGFACFLPATLATLTKHPITMSANYSVSAASYNLNPTSQDE